MLDPGDEVVIILPNYQQILGLTRSLGMKVKEVHLREERNRGLDLDELDSTATAATR